MEILRNVSDKSLRRATLCFLRNLISKVGFAFPDIEIWIPWNLPMISPDRLISCKRTPTIWNPQCGTHNLEPTNTHNLEPTTLWLPHLFSIKTNGRKIPETELQQILKNQILWSALQVSLDLSLEVGSNTRKWFWVKSKFQNRNGKQK